MAARQSFGSSDASPGGVGSRAAAWWLAVRGRLSPGALVLSYQPRRRPALRIRGPLAIARHAAIRGFFEQDLRPKGPVTIVARRAGATWRLTLAGALSPVARQRARNAMLDLLG